jgi:hypothetical protein
MKITPHSLVFWAILTIFFHHDLSAQTDIALLRDLAEENQKSVDALVLYPSETRLAILEATKHPETLIKMQDIRERTSAAFRTLIEDFPRATQAVFYDLNRYSGLVESLVSPKNEATNYKKSLETLPKEKREEAFGVITRQMETLVQINNLNQTTQRAFKRLISGQPAVGQRAFEHLLGLPEVIDLLNEDLRFTILVGETYRENPVWVIHKMDSLNLTVARSQAEELQNWKTDLENDPNARAELQSAARDYADENAYDSEYYSGDDFYEHDEAFKVRYYYEPYPYWYGYPYWSPYPRWHPSPWWWDWGGQIQPQGVVVMYLPSYYFMDWYFRNPRHHQEYNHLSTHFVNHYNGYRKSGTTISSGVREWRKENRTVVSDDFLTDKKRLPERLKAYGKFEEGRQQFNSNNPKKPVSQSDFLKKNGRKFPEIEQSRNEAKPEIQRENDEKREKNRDWAPQKVPITPEPTTEPKPGRQPMPSQKPSKTQPEPRLPREQNPTKTTPTPRPQRDEAREYHRQKVEEAKPRQQPQRVPTPKPSRTPTKNTGRGN